jgi:hypothetical protein
VGPPSNFWENLRRFVQRTLFKNEPKPFDYYIAQTVALPAANTWLDENTALQNRRAWVVVNNHYFDYTAGVAPTAVDFVYVNSVPIQAAGQGIWVYPNGGSISNPVGSGDAAQRVHVWAGTAATPVTFIQYA